MTVSRPFLPDQASIDPCSTAHLGHATEGAQAQMVGVQQLQVPTPEAKRQSKGEHVVGDDWEEWKQSQAVECVAQTEGQPLEVDRSSSSRRRRRSSAG